MMPPARYVFIFLHNYTPSYAEAYDGQGASQADRKGRPLARMIISASFSVLDKKTFFPNSRRKERS
jgi:hypothetical protein